MTDGQEEFLKILKAHRDTLEVCVACATATRDLAAEVLRGGLPTRDDLQVTVAEAERVVEESSGLRQELDRVIAELAGQ